MEKRNVYKLYDQIANWFDQNRYKGLMEQAYLNAVLETIPQKGSILDLGCGTGEPIAQFFIERGYRLTGIDAAQNMIAICRARFPASQFLCSDMRMLDLQEKFDAVIAWDSFFHLDHDDQRDMFRIFAAHIQPSGLLIFTSGVKHGEVWSEMNGHRFYHASLSTDEYQRLLHQHGFHTLMHKVEDPACGDHTVWVAQAFK